MSFEGRASEEAHKSRSQLGYSRMEMDSSEDERWLNESEEKVDRSKIELIEKTLQRAVEEVKGGRLTVSREVLEEAAELTGEELLHSKITNKLSFILGQVRKSGSTGEAEWLAELQGRLKERVVEHLYDTSYYDNCLRLIERNRRAKKDCEAKILEYLEGGYRVKHELAALMAARLVQEMAAFDPERERELLADMRVLVG